MSGRSRSFPFVPAFAGGAADARRARGVGSTETSSSCAFSPLTGAFAFAFAAVAFRPAIDG
jgi:hypothetical protein